MRSIESLKQDLLLLPKTWLVTGVAGFIGSNLLEALLKLNQYVVGLDNFSTGHKRNLDEVKSLVTPAQWGNFHFINGDIRNLHDCGRAMYFSPASLDEDGWSNAENYRHSASLSGRWPVDFVLHQAALGSVPRSIKDPIATNENNISGFLNILVAARDASVKRVVYAASSSTYGDHPDLPKVESKIGRPLSPYAVTKLVNELYANIFFETYGLQSIGLRYFNVFGRRQDPDGAYAAVIPKWISAMISNKPVYINGDGETSRDFCFVENAIQANLLAAMTVNTEAINQVFNVAVGERTSLNQLFSHLRDRLSVRFDHLREVQPIYKDFRAGDVRHSLADIEKARRLLCYEPTHNISAGIVEVLAWHFTKR